MSGKYDYLKKYINNPIDGPDQNSFYAVREKAIMTAEKRLGYDFSLSLKEFWMEIGCGFFRRAKNGENTIDHTNRLMPPSQIAEIILDRENTDLILPHAPLVEEALPIFEIADCYSFLVMIPASTKPEAVYTQFGSLIENSFERFIWRLYHESPTYYLDVDIDEKAQRAD